MHRRLPALLVMALIAVALSGCATVDTDHIALSPTDCVATELVFQPIHVRPSLLEFPDSTYADRNQMARLKLRKPSSDSPENVIREFELIGSLGDTPDPTQCGLGEGLWEKPALYCFKGVGKKISIRVVFEPETVHEPEKRVEELADYVKANVLCGA